MGADIGRTSTDGAPVATTLKLQSNSIHIQQRIGQLTAVLSSSTSRYRARAPSIVPNPQSDREQSSACWLFVV